MRTKRVFLFVATLSLGSVLLHAQARNTAELEREVRQQLILLTNASVFDNLTFQVFGSIVTLEGQVTTPALKGDAEGVVRRINGVEGVNNRIEVLPASPSDDHIRIAVLRAIYANLALDRYALGSDPPLRIIVRNGNVMLVGVVHTETERYDAFVRASNVPGVTSVANNLQVIGR